MQTTPVSSKGPTSKVGKTVESLSAAELLKKRLVDLGFGKAQEGLPRPVAQKLESEVGRILDASIKSLEARRQKSQDDADKKRKAFKENAASMLATLEQKISDRKKKIETDAVASLNEEVKSAVTAAVVAKTLATLMAKPSKNKASGTDTQTPTEPNTDTEHQEVNALTTQVVPPADSGDDLFDENTDGKVK